MPLACLWYDRSSLDTLAACDDGVSCINPRTHLIQIDVHGIHGGSEVLHIALACQHYPPDVVHLTFVVAQEILVTRSLDALNTCVFTSAGDMRGILEKEGEKERDVDIKRDSAQG